MDDKLRQVHEIEATQAALRESIEKSKQLAERADGLLLKHKQTLQDNEPSGDTSDQ